MENSRIAELFEELADLLDVAGGRSGQSRAYREVADAARSLEEPLEDIAARNGLSHIEGMHRSLELKVLEAIRTGTLAVLDRARATVPSTLLELLRVPGLGPDAVRRLWSEAGIASLSDLAEACETSRLAELEGFGAKKQARILESVRAMLADHGAMTLAVALDLAGRVESALREAGIRHVATVGDTRRGVEVVRELFVIAKGAGPNRIRAALRARSADLQARDIGLDAGSDEEDTICVCEEGVVRVRSVSDNGWIAGLVELTGSASHVRWLGSRAARLGGLRAVCERASTEAEVYARLGLPFPAPELREEPASAVPSLVSCVKGIFHVHTDWSDGTASIVEMAREAERAGFSYIGISDHSQVASYANGLDARRLLHQREAIAVARREVPGVAVLHGVEVDILEDGTLDLEDGTLGALDFVIASVHSHLQMDAARMTARIVRAVSHPLVTMLGHPTGRLLLGRRGYTFDIEAVARAAAANDVAMEINANNQRLDLSDTNARKAAAAGARLVINPDAHATYGIRDTALGVTVARRARLGDESIFNTKDRREMIAALAARKSRALARLA